MRRTDTAATGLARVAVILALTCATAAFVGCQRPSTAPSGPIAVTPPTRPTETPDPDRTIQTLTDEIDALETINHLAITEEQLPGLVEALQAAASARDKRQADKDRRRSELIPALEEHKGLLAKDEAVPAALSAKIAKLQQEIVRLDTIDPQVSATLADALRKILTKEQVLIAAGGLQARIQASETLDGFRELPRQAFEAEIGPYSQELAAGSSDTSPAQVEALLRDAVSLGEREYEENRDKIVRQLQPLFVPGGQTADQVLVDALTRPYILDLLRQRMSG